MKKIFIILFIFNNNFSLPEAPIDYTEYRDVFATSALAGVIGESFLTTDGSDRAGVILFIVVFNALKKLAQLYGQSMDDLLQDVKHASTWGIYGKKMGAMQTIDMPRYVLFSFAGAALGHFVVAKIKNYFKKDKDILITRGQYKDSVFDLTF